MKTQYHFVVIASLVASGLSPAAAQNRLPEGVPPLTGAAVARAVEGDGSQWSIAVTLPRDTWREVQIVMPKLNWPEPIWEEVRPGIREGTMTLPMGDDSMPALCAVVDMNGKRLGHDQIMQQLKTKTPVLVSVTGQVPHACYRRLPTLAKLIVLLGPGEKQHASTALSRDAEVGNSAGSEASSTNTQAAEPGGDLKDWGEQESQQYFFGLMQKRTNYKIASEQEASKYLRGIWRLDKRAHVGGGHYVRADQGDDVTVIYTGGWLLQTDFNLNTEGVVERIVRTRRIGRHPDGSLKFDASRKFMPIDDDHMAVAAYDYIAVVQRIACQSPEPDIDGEKVGASRLRRETEELPDRVSALAGWWRINPDFDELIGSPVRQDGQKFPKSLRLGIALPDAPVLDEETTALLDDKLVWRMGHTILATGDWKTEEESEFASDRDSTCILTAKDGVTYLWLGTPEKSLFGAEVHFIKGVDRETSLLILDFGSVFPIRMHKAEDVVAYNGPFVDLN
jgi:hypothetical protein